MIRSFIRWVRTVSTIKSDGQYHEQEVSYKGRNPVNSIIVLPYGLHSNVPTNQICLEFCAEANPSNKASIPLSTDRPDLEVGDVAVYSPITGDKVVFKSGGGIEAVSASNIVATAPTSTINSDVTINGSLTLNGAYSSTGTMTNNGQNVGNTHGHTQLDDLNGDQQAPIVGVT